jgi:hypothetical protein
METEKLQEVLRLHKLWLNNDDEGRWANLCEADLHGADLRKADLRGADLSWANLRGANLRLSRNHSIITAGPAGSRNDVTIYNIKDDELRCGCFFGTLDKFASEVEKNHKDNPVYLAEYRAMIVFFRTYKEARLER